MKILVLQLARLGDIYMSWPALRALRKNHPEAEIHVLTRPRFSGALEGLTSINRIHLLPTREILSPLIQDDMDVKQSMQEVSSFIDNLHFLEFDQIYNFSFSPLSSYLTHYISRAHTKVVGYSRFADGYLAIPDDMSAYFYAQVGIGRPNRFHLIEIFASLVGADLVAEDFRGPHPMPTTDKILPNEYLLVHIGASESKKSISPKKWIETFEALRAYTQIPVILIGSEQEAHIGQEISDGSEPGVVINLVGQTKISELFPIIKGARCLIGVDSAPMHMATLTGTPCVNVSLECVNFWETGPRSMDSVILRARNEQELSSERLAQVIRRNIFGEKQDLGVIHTTAGTPSYWTLTSKGADFDWLLLRALYLSEDFPSSDDPHFNDAITKLREINELMIKQLQQVVKTEKIDQATPFIERGEEIIETIAKLVPALQPLVRWYQTEKIRIPPGELTMILNRTLGIHDLLDKVLHLYNSPQVTSEKELL